MYTKKYNDNNFYRANTPCRKVGIYRFLNKDCMSMKNLSVNLKCDDNEITRQFSIVENATTASCVLSTTNRCEAVFKNRYRYI